MNVGNLLAENPRDTIEGEIVAAEPTELASRQEAQLRARRIRTHLQAAGNAYREIAEATARRDWQALGYESWEAWRDGEFGEERLVIPREARPQIAAIMHAAGASMRAIGSALGVGVGTVHRDLATVPDGTVPDRVMGRDGKERPATRPAPPERPEPAAEPKSTGETKEPVSVPKPVEQKPAVDLWSPEERELQRRLRDGETVVVSLRGAHDNLIRWAQSEDLYERVDRKTPWGNPFEMPADGGRDTVVANYAAHYLPYKPSLLSKLDTLRGKALGCWCAPERCHADVLVEFLESPC